MKCHLLVLLPLCLVGTGCSYSKFAAQSVAPPTGDQNVKTYQYRLKGDKSLWPIAMYEDGGKVHISWSATQAIPAVFALSDVGGEEMVDGYMRRGDVFVIDRICPRLIFRIDKVEAVAERVFVKAKLR